MSKVGVVIVTDAHEPHVNGVVTTLKETEKYLNNTLKTILDLDTFVIHPGRFPGHYISMKEMDWVYSPIAKKQLEQMLGDADPTFIHISTEGPLGRWARNFCIKNKWKFTTAYHTKFPEYFNMRYPFVPVDLGYKYFRWFHEPSSCVMVATYHLMQQLRTQEFYNDFKIWTRGVDTELFHPKHRKETTSGPYAVYVGRVSKEKGIEEFLDAQTDLAKIVVGSGPLSYKLERKYPGVYFVGKMKGIQLANFYASAEVFCFPSVTDTFGLVMPEALACGTPVAAKPVSSAVVWGDVACLKDNMSHAIAVARHLDRSKCRPFVLEHYTWDIAGKQFYNNLVPKH